MEIKKHKPEEEYPEIRAFNRFSEAFTTEIDKFLDGYFTQKIQESEFQFMAESYHDLHEYCLREGKRVRPLIVLLSYLGYRGRKNKINEIIKIASALELMHSFMLIQDDIIDNSTMRRGGKALHVVSNERYRDETKNKGIGKDIATILGDVLFSNAIEIIGNARIAPGIKSDFLGLFAKTYELTAWGQILDSLHSLPIKIDANDDVPTQIGTLKTAYYTICNPMLMGLQLAGRYSVKEADAIARFAIPLGLAFQIRDDILGVFGNRDEIGKSSESDILEGKMTILVLNTIKTLGKTELKKFMNIFTREKKTKSEIHYIKKRMQSSGALDRAMNKLSELADEVEQKLPLLGIRKEQRIVLTGIIHKITGI
jgi:geranylgeranyl diphosphate synthase type I